jgi:hypothetical protein
MKQPCAVQARLSEALEEATQRIHAAAADRNLALKENRNAGPYAVAVAAARADFSRAIKKLKAHKETHGCEPQSRRKKL